LILSFDWKKFDVEFSDPQPNTAKLVGGNEDLVLEAENGEDAIKILRSENNMVNVGVILCDIRMPKVNGLECIQFFRQEAPGIPIVVVTAYPDPEMVADLMTKGVKDYLVKPVKKEKMLGVVEKLISAGKSVEF